MGLLHCRLSRPCPCGLAQRLKLQNGGPCLGFWPTVHDWGLVIRVDPRTPPLPLKGGFLALCFPSQCHISRAHFTANRSKHLCLERFVGPARPVRAKKVWKETHKWFGLLGELHRKPRPLESASLVPLAPQRLQCPLILSYHELRYIPSLISGYWSLWPPERVLKDQGT